jgi:hypothetical protein
MQPIEGERRLPFAQLGACRGKLDRIEKRGRELSGQQHGRAQHDVRRFAAGAQCFDDGLGWKRYAYIGTDRFEFCLITLVQGHFRRSCAKASSGRSLGTWRQEFHPPISALWRAAIYDTV